MTAGVWLIFLCFIARGESTALPLTAAEKSEFVVIHNLLRQTALPTAAGMRFAVWSPKLEALAQTTAEKCVFDHPNRAGTEFASTGENIYGTTAKTASPNTTVIAWYNEIVDYDYGSGTCGAGKVCGHFTQVMVESVAELGCGRATDCTAVPRSERMNTIVFCEYSAGNIGGVKPYSAGPSCSKCPSEAPICLNTLCHTATSAASPEAAAVATGAGADKEKTKIGSVNDGPASLLLIFSFISGSNLIWSSLQS